MSTNDKLFDSSDEEQVVVIDQVHHKSDETANSVSQTTQSLKEIEPMVENTTQNTSEQHIPENHLTNDINVEHEGLFDASEDSESQEENAEQPDLTELSSGRSVPMALGRTAHITIPPQLKYSENETISLLNLPPYIGVDDHPYNPDTFNPEDLTQTYSSIRSATTKGVDGIIRWRTIPSNEIDGEPIIESNTRLIKWPDGLVQLQIGNEIFQISSNTIPSTKPTYLYTEDTSKSLRVLGMPMERIKLVNSKQSDSIMNAIMLQATLKHMNQRETVKYTAVSLQSEQEAQQKLAKSTREKRTLEKKQEKEKREQKYNEAIRSYSYEYSDEDIPNPKRSKHKHDKFDYDDDFIASDEDEEIDSKFDDDLFGSEDDISYKKSKKDKKDKKSKKDKKDKKDKKKALESDDELLDI